MRLYVQPELSGIRSAYTQQHETAVRILERMLFFQSGGRILHPKIEKDTQGKPYLPEYPEIYFNISHCPVCVAVVTDDVPVGIDVERRFAWNEALARRVCHPRELKKLMRMEEQERQAALCRIWSRKESYLKCVGSGLREELSAILAMDQGRELRTEKGVFSFHQTQSREETLCVCRRER